MSEFLFVEEYLGSTIKLSKTVPLTDQLSVGSKKKKAFTLAEVLIVLGIIGMVAEMTLPTLTGSYQKTTYITGLKKVYTEFNQVLTQLSADNDCIGDLSCTGLFNSGTTSKTLGAELVKYFKVTKNCEITPAQGCMSNNGSQYYDGLSRGWNLDNNGTAYKFITANGTSFFVYNDANGCANSGVSIGKTGDLKQKCGTVVVDLNGPQKGPNNQGTDVFYFFITNGHGPKLYPYGGSDQALAHWLDDSGNPQSCYPGNTEGYACAARVIEEGWQMTYYGTHSTAAPADPYGP